MRYGTQGVVRTDVDACMRWDTGAVRTDVDACMRWDTGAVRTDVDACMRWETGAVWTDVDACDMAHRGLCGQMLMHAIWHTGGCADIC